MEEAAPAQRVRQITGAVAGQDHQRLAARGQGSELGNADLELGEHLQQKRLESLIRAVNFIDQQDARLGAANRLQQRPLQQKFLGKQIAAQGVLVCATIGFAQTDLQQLAAVVPLVHRLPQIQALVALQAQKRTIQCPGAGCGDSGFTDPGFAL